MESTEDTDDLSKLEELLAADSSDEDSREQQNEPARQLISEAKQPQFLQEEEQKEYEILLNGKKNIDSGLKIDLCDSSKPGVSHIHMGDTDSSDDEEKKNFLERKYTDYGLDVKKILQHRDERKSDFVRNDTGSTQSFKAAKIRPSLNISKNSTPNSNTIAKDIYTDPIFGMRIIKPLLSSSALKERMQGREAITLGHIKRHVAHGDLNKDWVVAGTIVRKSIPKESQKGSQYSIWTLSDLRDDLKTVSVFLFRNAYKQLWKTNQGMVIGILNPNVLDKRDDSTDQACLSVDNPEKVMIFGNSKDFGFCKSKKKNGDPCAAFVNLNQCEYCVYHVKQEYQKCSRRSDLQSATAGRGLVDLRNKVLGKNTFIYGGQSFSAIPAVKSKKQTAKDNNRLQTLSDYFKTADRESLIVNKAPIANTAVKKMAPRVEASRSQRLKDLERLEFLSAGSSKHVNVSSTTSFSPKQSPVQTSKLSNSSHVVDNKNASPNTDLKLKSPMLGIPTLGFGLKKSSLVDLTLPFSKKQSERAKGNALKWIKENGPLNKANPHNVRGTTEGKKRSLSVLNTSDENCEESEQTQKKPKTGIASERFQNMLAATSAHTDLIVQHDDTEVDKYFAKLEKKEMMEEKMMNTFKLSCKAVRCLKCSYTSFSAADRCKQEKHPLKVFDAFKRFFKCLHCGNRQISLDVIPTHSCKNCKSSRWQRTGMMAEKKAVTLASTLSITGEEEHLGHVQHGASINLLVPEDGA